MEYKITNAKKEEVVSFDFAKKPIRPTFLLTLAKWIISWPDLKKRNFILQKVDMEDVKGPYLLLVTHSSMVDFNVMLKATHPDKVNNVMTLEGFHTYTEPLMRSLGVLGTRKFIDDVYLVKNMKYCVERLKTTFVLFPEARYSLDGCTSHLPSSLGKMVRLLKIPVVVLKIHGNFVTCPQWNKINKKTYVEAEMKKILSENDCRNLSVQKINEIIQENFLYDDFKWQYDNRIRIAHQKRAEGLNRLLYKCPACFCEGRMEAKDSSLFCTACKKVWEMDEYGRMHATEGKTEFSHIPDWSNWERECVRKEIQEGTYYFEDEVRVETLPGSKRFYHHGMGKLIQTPEETRIECQYYGEPYVLVKKPQALESMHIEYDYLGQGDCVDISVPDDSFWCYLSKKDAITKLSFATEEIYRLAVSKMQKG